MAEPAADPGPAAEPAAEAGPVAGAATEGGGQVVAPVDWKTVINDKVAAEVLRQVRQPDSQPDVCPLGLHPGTPGPVPGGPGVTWCLCCTGAPWQERPGHLRVWGGILRQPDFPPRVCPPASPGACGVPGAIRKGPPGHLRAFVVGG